MKITHWKFFKYFYSGILVLWILITVHVVYAFVYDISEQVPVKGGTFVHGVFSQATYLPYLSNTGEDKFFQSLLFNGCLSPYVDNTNIEFEEDLCNIKTSNFRVFEISVKEGKKWNDGTPITNDDIFFTYNELIKNNIRNISSLNSFSNLEIQDQGDFIKIIFPNGSKDNEIFLSNFILPRHLLKGKDVTYYVENYSNNPIGSNCATFRQSTSDKDSIIFDMNNCDESFVMNYQVKNFDSFEDFQKYQKNSDLIDLYIGNDLLNGFRNNKVILNNFVSIFFNVEADNVSSNIRRTISQIIYNNIYKGDYKKYFIKDKFLFDTDIQGGAPRTVFEELEKEITSPKEVEVELENMPNELNLENLTGTFYLDSIDDLFNISFDLGQNFDSVSVQHNDGQAYVLQGYDQSSIARYNISERFQNIKIGKNDYILRGKINGEEKELYNISLYYKEKPLEQIPATSNSLNYNVLYFKNELNEYVVSKMKEIFESEGILEFFTFKGIDSSEEFQGQVQSQNYDIVIRGINMGLKKDISNIFMTSDPQINPSGYINNDMASNINQYFINDGKTKNDLLSSIHSKYSNEVPFIILGKVYGNLNIKKSSGISFPERLYDYRFIIDYIDNIIVSKRPKIDGKKILDNKKFINFIRKNISE